MNVKHPNYGLNVRLTDNALVLGTFTVSELESLTGASENTVYAFLHKLEKAGANFLESTKIASPLRGAPRKRYSLTPAGTAYLTKLSHRLASRFEAEKAEEHTAIPAVELEEHSPVAEQPQTSSLTWNPFAELTSLRDRFNALSPVGEQATTFTNFLPPVDIYEHGSDLIIRAEVPGITATDLDLRIEGNVLTIAGERKFETETRRDKFHRMERRYGRFSRSFTLPASVNAESIHADFENGVLKVTLANAAQAQGQNPTWAEPIAEYKSSNDSNLKSGFAQGTQVKFKETAG